MDDHPASRLARWRRLQNTPQEGRAELHAFLERPEAASALRRLSQNMLALAERDPAFDGIAKDVGRFAATSLAMYLHVCGGLTLPRLKEVCARTTVISPGRARALLLYLRFLRYVEPIASDSRATRYAPTPDMMNARRMLIRETVDAAEIVEPAIALVSNRLSDARTLETLIRIEGEAALTTLDLGEKDNPYWRVFLNRYAGMQILHRLMLSAPESDAYPPRGPIPYATAELAREFRVSRPHVARLLKAAEQEGLIAIHGDGKLTLLELARDHIRHSMGTRLLLATYSIARLYAEMDENAAGAPVAVTA